MTLTTAMMTGVVVCFWISYRRSNGSRKNEGHGFWTPEASKSESRCNYLQCCCIRISCETPTMDHDIIILLVAVGIYFFSIILLAPGL